MVTVATAVATVARAVTPRVATVAPRAATADPRVVTVVLLRLASVVVSLVHDLLVIVY